VQELLPGQVLDQYQVVDVMARSGMASIYRARDLDDGRTVVLKVPHLQYESDIVFHERFRREEEIGLRLDHPSIIKVYRPRTKSRVYLVLEYVEGETLRVRLERERDLRGTARLSVATAVELSAAIADAVAYLHEHGVVHRDLKPENVMITPSGRIKIMDFGIALDRSARRVTWGAGLSQVTGTPDYMAPEQVQGRRGDQRADVYSMGVMLYEMLTGAPPFPAANLYASMQQKVQHQATPPRQLRPEIPTSLEAVVLRALARDPEDRPASAARFRDWLLHPERMPAARPEPLGRDSLPGRPEWVRALGWALAILVASALLGWALSHIAHPPRPGVSVEAPTASSLS
jgi:eukaryotic-like serine/threonine-protein kinase